MAHNITGLVDCRLLMSGRDEVRLVLRRRKIDAVLEAGMEEFVEVVGVGGHRIFKVFDG